MWCESKLNPSAININLNKTIDYSYWQINDYYWGEYFKAQGLDIKNPQDNLVAGFILHSKYGSQPWNWSKDCWLYR